MRKEKLISNLSSRLQIFLGLSKLNHNFENMVTYSNKFTKADNTFKSFDLTHLQPSTFPLVPMYRPTIVSRGALNSAKNNAVG